MTRSPCTPAQLSDIDSDALKALWSKAFRSSPPSHAKRELLIRLLAYSLQEQAQDGLSRPSRKVLSAIAGAPASTKEVATTADASSQSLRLGARLVRSWNGVTHEVTVLDRGFAYRGGQYRSLTQIAEVITGAHWSGPRFFGLKRASAKSAERASA